MKSWTLIVGMDFSDFGERAFRQAVRMAAHRAGECVVHIAHAVTEKDMASPGSKVERQAEALGHAPREIWNRVVKILEQEQIALDAVPIWQHVRLGEPLEVIRQGAVDYEGDLVIVGTRGNTGMKKLVLGSVADGLIRDGRFPVLVAHENKLGEMEKTTLPDEPLTPEQEEARKSAAQGMERHHYKSTLIDAWKGLGRPTSPTF